MIFKNVEPEVLLINGVKYPYLFILNNKFLACFHKFVAQHLGY